MSGAILYKSKYGSTFQYAEWLSKELDLPILEISKVSSKAVSQYQYLVIGSPVYIGKLLIASWLSKHERLFQHKKLFLFVVCATCINDAEKLDRFTRENVPASLSGNCTISFMPGRIIRKNLSWRDKTLLKMGASVERDPSVKRKMMEDFDNVNKENLRELVNKVRYFREHPKPAFELLYTLKHSQSS